MTAEIGPARPEEGETLRARLEEDGLPTAGFFASPATTLVARDGERVLGCVALELYGETALLRSLVVVPEARGLGLGERLTAAALELARERGVRSVYLLTTTAERFFPRFGFGRLERSSLPVALDASAELRGACPASAVAMGLDLATAST